MVTLASLWTFDFVAILAWRRFLDSGALLWDLNGVALWRDRSRAGMAAALLMSLAAEATAEGKTATRAAAKRASRANKDIIEAAWDLIET